MNQEIEQEKKYREGFEKSCLDNNISTQRNKTINGNYTRASTQWAWQWYLDGRKADEETEGKLREEIDHLDSLAEERKRHMWELGDQVTALRVENEKLKAENERLNKVNRDYLCNRNVEEYREWTAGIFTILSGIKVKPGSHLPDGLLGIQGMADKAMKQNQRLKDLVKRAKPWVEQFHTLSEVEAERLNQWLADYDKEIGG